MNIAIFGATGGTGRPLVDRALASGHTVTALVRTPASLPITHERLHAIQGDVRNPDDVAALIGGQDAVLSALGPNERGPVSLCGDGIANILAAMASHNVRRLVALSAYGVADSHHRNLYTFAVWALRKEKMVDKERMEALIRRSDVDWTIIRPSALTDRPPSGRYHTAVGLHLRITATIARADLADFMLHCATDGTYRHETPAITAGSMKGAPS